MMVHPGKQQRWAVRGEMAEIKDETNVMRTIAIERHGCQDEGGL